jgi:O-antigen biosynthesis protein
VKTQLSVVMVTHGARDCVHRALGRVYQHTHASIEVIVIDNDSSDGTPDMIARDFPQVTLIRNEHNVGFGVASNQGARIASAPILLFLNSDAFVESGWLEPLQDAVAQPGVGAVVPMLLHEDGRLQDAGPLLASDGSAFEYGAGDDPSRFEYRFRRVVDFGPAACMLLRRATFEDVGGFDPVFSPAYYEDADLCMRLAERGLRTVYEPAVRVAHRQHASGSSEVAVKLSDQNRKAFLRRWGSRLKDRPARLAPDMTAAIIAARDAPASGRLLAIEASLPPISGRLGEYLGAAGVRHADTRMTVLVLTDPNDDDADDWLASGIEVATVESTMDEWLQLRRGHYDVALIGAGCDPSAASVEKEQPQATIVSASPELGEPADIFGTAGVLLG